MTTSDPNVGAVRPLLPLSERQHQRLAALVAELAQVGTGASLAVVAQGQLVALTAGRLWDSGPPVEERSPFNVASVTKLLTAARVVSLAHQERLALDDPVTLYLPGVTLVDREGQDQAGKVTLRRLLMHRGGLPRSDADLDPKKVGTNWNDPELLSKLASSWTIPLVTQPGLFRYSNLGYALLAAVVEQVENCSFADCMTPYLGQLGMESATFWPPAVAGPAARGRVFWEGEFRYLEPAWFGSRFAIPYTGLFTSMPDLARFGAMLAVAAGDEAAPLHAMTRLKRDRGYGPGPVVHARHGMRTLEHDGGGPGFMAWLVVIPERQLAVAVACNGGNESLDESRRLREVVASVHDVLLGVASER